MRFPVERTDVGHPRASTADEGVLAWASTTRCPHCSALHGISIDGTGAWLEFAYAPTDPIFSASRLAWSRAGTLAFAKESGPTHVVRPTREGWRTVATLHGARPLCFCPSDERLVLTSVDDARRLSLCDLRTLQCQALPEVPLEHGTFDRWEYAFSDGGRWLRLAGRGRSGAEVVSVDLVGMRSSVTSVFVPTSASFSWAPGGERLMTHWSTGPSSTLLSLHDLAQAGREAPRLRLASHSEHLPGRGCFDRSGGFVVAHSGEHLPELRVRRFDAESLELAAATDVPNRGGAGVFAAAVRGDGAIVVVTRHLTLLSHDLELVPVPDIDLTFGETFELDASGDWLAWAGPAHRVLARPDILFRRLPSGEVLSLRAALAS